MKVLEKFKKMKKLQKVEFAVALSLTTAFMVALPVYAWFSKNKNLETITKIQKPGSIIIRAGKTLFKTGDDADDPDPIVNLEMQDIDIEAISAGEPEYVVFSVTPGNYGLGTYNLQIAHTTNIPIKYTLYRATEYHRNTNWHNVDSEDNHETFTDKYIAENNLVKYNPMGKTYPTYYQIGAEVVMKTLNADETSVYGREVAKTNDDCYGLTYSTSPAETTTNPAATTTTSAYAPLIYAVPIYLQTIAPIEHRSESNTYDYFILKLEYDQTALTNDEKYAKWNIAANNKETDMIYITAEKTI